MEKFIKKLEQNKLSEEQIESVLAHARVKNFKNQETVFDFRSSCQEVYFILKGAFVLKYWDEVLENERVVNFFLDAFTPFMGDINNYFTEKGTESRLMAIKNSKILVFNKKDIDLLSDKYEGFRKLVTNQIIETLVLENNFRIHLITKTKQNLYTYLLNYYPQIVKEIPSKYIAEFMGISPEWLSKIKRKLLIS